MNNVQSKYHNRKVVVEGYAFDSLAEARRYQELSLLERAGEIRSLRVHSRHLLFPAFTDRQGRKWRAIFYVDDFNYVEARNVTTLIVEDTKGVETEVFRIKRKLLLARYPEIDFRVLKNGRVLGGSDAL